MDAHARGMGFLIVGAGRSGRNRAVAALVARDSRLVAVADPQDPEAALEVAEQLGASVGTDVESALRLDGVDAVVVAVPPDRRLAMVRLALEYGKHVLCEAPVAPTPDEARALASEADARRLRLASGFPRRFEPPIRDALALLSRWGLGRILSVRVDAGPEPADQAEGGDVVREGDALEVLGPEACDLIRRFLGEVVAAKGYIQERLNPQIGSDREAVGLFRDHDRGLAELRTSWGGLRSGLTVEVVGTEGSLRAETCPWRLVVERDGRSPVRRSYRAEQVAAALFRRWHGCERALVHELEAFVAAVGVGRSLPSGASGWDGCRAQEMVEAVRRSDWSGQEVELEPLAVRTPAMGRRRSLRRRIA